MIFPHDEDTFMAWAYSHDWLLVGKDDSEVAGLNAILHYVTPSGNLLNITIHRHTRVVHKIDSTSGGWL